MSYAEQYIAKKCSPKEAVSMICNDDVVFMGGEPSALLEALYLNRKEYSGLKLYSAFGLSGVQADNINSEDLAGHIGYTTTVLKRREERAWMRGNVDQVLVHFSELEDLIEQRYRPTVLLTHCSPPDAEGWLNMHGQAGCGCGRSVINCGARVIVEVNEAIPTITTDYYRIHISEVSALCESNAPPAAADVVKQEPSKVDELIAAHVVERIPDGATIQLGAGSAPAMVGHFLENHKDLGIHTELFGQTLARLMKKGAVNNSKKTVMPGLSVAAFLGGGKETHDFANKNPAVMFKQLSWVNNPAIISQIDNMTSINSCLGVDLRGQVCSESIGFTNTGGLGGQLDFIRGTRASKGGKSFIVMRSMLEKKDGTKVSKITLNLPEGSVVSTPRSDVMYIATEYGIADLHQKSHKERARALIEVAHPEFRDLLTYQAKKHCFI